MDYDIKRIDKTTPIKGVFFFDTMIWLDILAPKFSKDNNRKNKYISFFDKVNSSPSAKIAVSALSISEVTNTYFKTVAIRMYEKEENTKVLPNEFKTKYRPTEHFKNQYQIVCDEIEARADSLEFSNYTLKEADLTDAVNYPKLDFNDYCYYKMCQENSFTLVTDDGDFFVRNVPILTLNKRLIDKYHEELVKGKL